MSHHPPLLVRASTLERKGSLDKDIGTRSQSEQLTALNKASPFGQMLENVKKLALSLNLWDDEMQRDLPKKWVKHGEMIVFPQNSFTHNNWRYIGRGMWKVVAESLKIAKLGRERIIDDDSFRTAHVDLLYGDNAWIEYVDERGIRFQYEATKRVFNNQKVSEMKRISEWDCHGETIVDMYAGLGNYAFTFLIACHAKKVVAIDWDEDMLEALLRTAEANNVTDKLVPIQGDSRRMTPSQIADRVYSGLIPSCRAHWLTACKALKPEGGMLHISELLKMGDKKKEAAKKPSNPAVAAAKKPIISKLPSVDEEGSSKENKPLNLDASKPKPKLKDIGSTKTSTEKAPENSTSEKKTVKKVIKKKETTATVAKKTAKPESEKKTNETETNTNTNAENPDVEPKPEEPEYYIDENGERKVKRKFSRSASIVEEMESRVLPNPKIWKEFESAWNKLDEPYKDFAMDCATSCTRFLNNINLCDAMYCVTICGIARHGSPSLSQKHSEHIVVDLLCCPENAAIETLAGRFMNTNLKQ